MRNSSDIKKVMRQVVVLLMTIAVGLLIYVCLSQLSGWLTMHQFESNFIGQLTFLLGKVWLPWVVLSPLVAFIALRLPISPERWPWLLFCHFLLLLLLSFLHGLAIAYYHHHFAMGDTMREAYQPIQHIGHFLFGGSLFLFNIIIYMIFIASFNLRSFTTLPSKKTWKPPA